MHTVIVGGGFAGVKAARELSRFGTGKITLISDQPYFLHHATLYATATGKSFAESVVPLDEIFAGDTNVKVVCDTITEFDSAQKTVSSAHETYPYDRLILALGSVTTYFNIKGMANHALGVKTMDEVKAFRARIKEDVMTDRQFDKNYVIIGGGATGVELAGALQNYLAHLKKVYPQTKGVIRIVLVEAAPRILPRLSPAASRIVTKRLRNMGVKVFVNRRVEKLNDDTMVINGKTIATETAIWTSGVANNPFYAAHAATFSCAKNGRVMVDQYLEAMPNVYVLGDNNTVKYSGQALPAMQQAEYTARRIAFGLNTPFRPKPPLSGIPVGNNWAYVEWRGLHISGRLGHCARRRMERYGYETLLPARLANTAYKAHDITEVDV